MIHTDNTLIAKGFALNLSTNGVFATTALIDNYTDIVVTQTSGTALAPIVGTLPNPTNVDNDTLIRIRLSAASTGFLTIYGKQITSSTYTEFLFDGGAWRTAGALSLVEQSKTSPIASAQANTQMTVGEFDWRYETNASGGQLQIRSAVATTIWWNGEEEFIVTETQQGAATLALPANTWTNIGTIGAAIREWITYRVSSNANFYNVQLINHNDTNIHLKVTDRYTNPLVVSPISSVGQYSSSIDQALPLADTQLVINTVDMPIDGLTLVSNTFTCTAAGKYKFEYQPQITQIVAGVATIWVRKNGLAVTNNVTNSAIKHGNFALTSTSVPILILPIQLAAGETISFWAKSSIANALTIDVSAADATAPATPASILTISRFTN